MAIDISRQPALKMRLGNIHATAVVIRGITHGFACVLRIAVYSAVQKRSCTLQQTDKKYHKGDTCPIRVMANTGEDLTGCVVIWQFRHPLCVAM